LEETVLPADFAHFHAVKFASPRDTWELRPLIQVKSSMKPTWRRRRCKHGSRLHWHSIGPDATAQRRPLPPGRVICVGRRAGSLEVTSASMPEARN